VLRPASYTTDGIILLIKTMGHELGYKPNASSRRTQVFPKSTLRRRSATRSKARSSRRQLLSTLAATRPGSQINAMFPQASAGKASTIFRRAVHGLIVMAEAINRPIHSMANKRP